MSNKQQQQAGGNITNSPQINGDGITVNIGENCEARLTHWLLETCCVKDNLLRKQYVQAILRCDQFDISLLNEYHTILTSMPTLYSLTRAVRPS